MALKKSDLYSSIWASCDELRGGMDASQYKDYVLFMLFIKYISDKYGDSDDFAPPVTIPKGASFKDMVALKGDTHIGDKINTQVIQPLIDANSRLARSDFPDFNDPNKLGEGSAKVERLSNLIAIFQKPELDFSKNRAEHDDILGDAYEYLMRHFASESGKSKGQFYTPSEVSRIIAKVIGISPANAVAATTAYDPTCGSGSLLLKVAAQAGKHITLEGQEKDVTTAGLARMNMILHDFPTANVLSGNTLFDPKFKDGVQLRTYDYVVANPPFSDKTWSTGLAPAKDSFQRFTWGVPPKKQGDYAYLLHIIRSMKSAGKAACILPHGVLFRGNVEAVIRRQLVRSGYAISRLEWIREQQSKLRDQAREAPRKFVERESHYLWGRRHLLTIVYRETKPFVSLDHRRITLTVRPGSDAQKRAEAIHEWHKSLLHDVVPPLIKKWEPKLKVRVARYFLQRMKTKWGSCNHKAEHIRLNTHLVTKPKDLLEYVIAHEMVHLIEPTHSERFLAILGNHYPSWREARVELNELPLAAEVWKE